MTKHNRGFFVFFIILSLGLSPAIAATKAAKPFDLKGLREFVVKTMPEWKVPGMAVAIIKDGKVIFAEGFGFRDVKQGLKVTPQTVFAIGSCSKAFTAADVGILVDEGKLCWDKPVRTYLPDFELQDEYASAHVTPRDLLSHRTGLARHDLMWLGGQFSRSELYARLRYLEMNKELRAGYEYQNLMLMTVGILVGKVAGSSWEEFTQKRIFDPLGMRDSNFSVSATQKGADFSWPYAEIMDKVEQIPFRNIDAIGPAGSINSNILDMAQWVLMNLNKGKIEDKQIVSEASMAQIHSPQTIMTTQIRYDEILSTSYCFGWAASPYRGHLLLRHGGGIDGFISQVALLPRENCGVVILSNLNGTPLPGIITYNIVDRLLDLDVVDWNMRTKDDIAKGKAEEEKALQGADKDRKPGTQPSRPLGDYIGEYENPGYGTVSVTKDGAGLTLKNSLLDCSLSHYHYDVFKLKAKIVGEEIESKVMFSGDINGNISSLSIQLESTAKDIVFTKAVDKGKTK